MRKTKIKSSKVIILAIGLLIIFSMLIVIPINVVSATAAESEMQEYETKTYSHATIDDDFDDSSVIIVMDKYVGGINKRHEESFFGKFPKGAVEDLTYITGDIYSKKYLSIENFRQTLKIELPEKSKKNVIETIRQLEKIDGILWVGPNYYYKPAALPPAANGTRYSQQWGLHGANGIQAQSAWDITTGNNNVSVGVIDSGIANHPDLNANLVAGWDFVNHNAITNDDTTGHGTHVAGTIGATGTNVDGVVGVSWNVQIVPLQVQDSNGWPSAAITSAITWARNNDIGILNLSGGATSEDPNMKVAISSYTGLFVCAAGNEDRNNDIMPQYPSDYSRGQTFSDRVISVGAIMSNGMRPDASDWGYDPSGNPIGSNYGANSVSLFAPGDAILSTTQNGYFTLSGTSMATPHVTGAAALMFAYYLTKPHTMTPEQISAQIKLALINNVYKSSSLNGLCVAGGYLNAYLGFLELPFTNQIFNDFGYSGSTFYWNGNVNMTVAEANQCNVNSSNVMTFVGNTTLSFQLGTLSNSNAISTINGNVSFELKNSAGEVYNIEGTNKHISTVNVTTGNVVTLGNTYFEIYIGDLTNDTYTLTLTSVLTRALWTDTDTKAFTFIVNRPSSCIAEGTLITLADGSKKPVEMLTMDDLLLVWNHQTGNFDVAPMLFIDNDPIDDYDIIHLYFSDGSEVKVIYEHAFWNATLNRYVFIRNGESTQYIGDWFNKQKIDANGNMIWENVQLVDVQIYTEQTTAWSPVTFAHLNYYVNGMLSMPGATEGLINIFEVNANTLQYNQATFLADIQTYGLYEYADFEDLMPEIIFEAFQAQYMTVSIGKGLITWEEIEALIERYSVFWS